ncbi:nitrile hydratase subunit beta [Antrihabitans spumae]|uniref:Nitrile hydratase subunit beta n=1 Tax=Antrihabitans spumae TaxID=3373370 RepID=A0ABW7KBH1_9NOCA
MPEVHDLGGRAEHYGPVPHDADEPPFHQRWEERVFGIVSVHMTAMSKPVDEFRFDMEQLPPEQYLPSYFGRWLAAFENGLVRDEHLRAGELDALVRNPQAAQGNTRPRVRTMLTATALRASTRPTMPAWICTYVLPRQFGAARRSRNKPEFSVGDKVRVRARRGGHTRQPGYVTGKVGVVVANFGSAVFPDARAVGRREPPQHLYTVEFTGRELWGDAAEAGTSVLIELYQPYLEGA